MLFEEHITDWCPAIRRDAGEEPYPQLVVEFDSAPTGTVQVEIYDVSTQPPTRLTTSALSGAELSQLSLTGLSNAYAFDTGHANSVAVLDGETSEHADIAYVFEDNGGTGEKHRIKVSYNTETNVQQLYPGQVIFADDSSTFTGTAFPAGSFCQKSANVSDFCNLLTNRGYKILDISGATFDGGTDVPNSTKCGTHLHGVTIQCRAGFSAVWYPNVDTIPHVEGTFSGVNGNLAVATYGSAANSGPHTLIGCTVKVYRATGTGSRWGEPEFIDCICEGNMSLLNVSGGSGAANCWSGKWTRCTFISQPTIDLSSMGSSSASVTSPTAGFDLANVASKTLNIIGVIGSPDLTFNSTVTNSTINLTGAYNTYTDNGSGNTFVTAQLAHRSHLVGNLVNLAAGAVDATSLADGAITAAKAPNLDAAMTSRAAAGDAMALTAAERTTVQGLVLSDATPFAGASVTEGRLAELDAANLPADVAAVKTSADAAARPGDAMTLAAGAIAAATFAANALSSAALSTAAAQKIRDEIDGTASVVGKGIRLIKTALDIDTILNDGNGGDLPYDSNGFLASATKRGWDDPANVPATHTGTEAADTTLTYTSQADSQHNKLPRFIRGVSS